MAASDAYGPMFHTLATRFKQHDQASNARASAQADMSKSRSRPSASNARRPSYISTDSGSTVLCPSCHLLRRTSTGSSASSAHSLAAHHHIHDEYFGSFCPDIAAPTEHHSHSSHASQHHRRRHSLLADKDRDVGDDSSASSHTSPTNSQSSASFGPPEQRHLGNCQCGTVKPTENLEERYGFVQGRDRPR